MNANPPKWADALLRWFCDPDLLEEVQGDLYELHYYRCSHDGRRYADVKFAWEVLRLFRLPLVRNPFMRENKLSAGHGTVVKLEGWNDIVFESRNKEYGAYRIRNSYDKNMLFGFFIVVSIWTMIVLWWWINLYPDPTIP